MIENITPGSVSYYFICHIPICTKPTNENNRLWSRYYKFWREFQLQNKGSLSYLRCRVCVLILLISCYCSNESYLITEQVENHQSVEAMLCSGRRQITSVIPQVSLHWAETVSNCITCICAHSSMTWRDPTFLSSFS